MSIVLDGLLNLPDLQLNNLTEFLGRRITLVLLEKLIGGVLDFIADSKLALRTAHHIAVFGYGLQYALANPPDGIGDELESACLVELIGSSDKADISFIDKIG